MGPSSFFFSEAGGREDAARGRAEVDAVEEEAEGMGAVLPPVLRARAAAEVDALPSALTAAVDLRRAAGCAVIYAMRKRRDT